MTPVWTHSSEPSVCDPDARDGRHPQADGKGAGREEPVAAVSLGGTDAKHWRHRGVPAYIYGCTPNNMAKADEWVDIEEYLHVVRVHALAAADYLGG